MRKADIRAMFVGAFKDSLEVRDATRVIHGHLLKRGMSSGEALWWREFIAEVQWSGGDADGI